MRQRMIWMRPLMLLRIWFVMLAMAVATMFLVAMLA